MSLLTDLGVRYPVIQAPMAGVQDSRLAIAVCEAGGLGSLPCAMLAPDAMRQELEALRTGTRAPYNVNFFCHVPPSPSAEREAKWRQLLAPYFREFGIDPATIPSGPGRLPFSAEAAAVLEEFKPAVVSFHFGLPDAALLERVRRSRARIWSSATTLEEARWLEAHGVDAIIVQGVEAGGHRGIFLGDDLASQRATFALLPEVVRAVKVPVIAAGGIADAQGVTRALAAGAAAAQVGTAYLLCPEATTSAVHRAALRLERRETALTNVFTGRPARGILNRVMREVGPLNPAAPHFPLATSAIAPLRAKAEASGSSDFSPLWSGDYTGRYAEMPAAQLTRVLAGAG